MNIGLFHVAKTQKSFSGGVIKGFPSPSRTHISQASAQRVKLNHNGLESLGTQREASREREVIFSLSIISSRATEPFFESISCCFTSLNKTSLQRVLTAQQIVY